MSEAVIRAYYACFNERRFVDAIMLFADDAVLENMPFGRQHRGSIGYAQFAQVWTAAFPDATFTIERIDHRSDGLFDVHLISTGTHTGALDIGAFRFKATGVRATLRFRELLDIQDEKIRSSHVSFDLADLIRQLSIVDYTDLMTRMIRLRDLTDELERALGSAEGQRAVAERLGPELDAARRALRPHYK